MIMVIMRIKTDIVCEVGEPLILVDLQLLVVVVDNYQFSILVDSIHISSIHVKNLALHLHTLHLLDDIVVDEFEWSNFIWSR